MLYIKAKIVLLMCVIFSLCAFWFAEYHDFNWFMAFAVSAVFAAIAHMHYDFAYLDYDGNPARRNSARNNP